MRAFPDDVVNSTGAAVPWLRVEMPAVAAGADASITRGSPGVRVRRDPAQRDAASDPTDMMFQKSRVQCPENPPQF